ncbi:MAG: serine hydrolase domain-containing protein [Caulobacterales bacterium]
MSTEIMARPSPALPPQPRGVDWPTEAWPMGDVEAPASRKSVVDAVERFFAPETTPITGETHAVVIVQGGRLVLERYAEGFGPDVTCHSWSMAKSITQALVGLAVGDGKVDVSRPPDAPEWSARGDPRAAITLDQMLRMSSGLAFVEDYVPGHVSDVIEMLFGSGKEDVAHYAASRPLEHAPGSHFYYSSGTTNIISRSLGRALELNGAAFERFMRARLFEPLGMKSPLPRFDEAGTFIGSSYCFCTPRDFARFGLLYLRDGVWEGRRLLPEGWVDYARTRTWQQADCPEGPYGAHWWIDMFGQGVFSANGYDGQYIIIRPDRDLIVIRHGLSPLDAKERLQGRLGELVALFD